jgi:hypothetical protein
MRRLTMNKSFCLSFSILTLFSSLIHAAPTEDKKTHFFKDYYLNALYSYRDFGFKSEVGDNFNDYRGHTNLIGLGANHFHINDKTSAGIFLFHTITSLKSGLFLGLPPVLVSDQIINNNSLYGHILRQVKSNFYLDLSLGYSQNKTRFEDTLRYPLEVQTGQASTRGHNLFEMVSAYLAQTKGQWSLREDLRVMHAYSHQRGYDIVYQPSLTQQQVSSFSNRSVYTMENVELTYNGYKLFQPFVNAGLIQVPYFQNSVNVNTVPVIGPFPELNLNQAGYVAGLGINATEGRHGLRLEFQYTNRGPFESSQVTAAYRIQID